MILEYLAVPRNKEVLRENEMMGACKSDTCANLKQLPMTNVGTVLRNKINSIVLNYNPVYTISICESILI